MRKSWRMIVALTVAAAAVVTILLDVFTVSGQPQPPLPALLRGASARAGFWGACPPTDEAQAREMATLGLSPEFEQRLSQQFPPGSREDRLLMGLAEQGFETPYPCPNDASVRWSLFKQTGGTYVQPAMQAVAYWKVAADGTIQWTHGFVAFTGS
jgi:hypothetical protein